MSAEALPGFRVATCSPHRVAAQAKGPSARASALPGYRAHHHSTYEQYQIPLTASKRRLPIDNSRAAAQQCALRKRDTPERSGSGASCQRHECSVTRRPATYHDTHLATIRDDTSSRVALVGLLSGLPRSLECLGTTAPAAESQGNRTTAWYDQLNYVWSRRTAEAREALEQRAHRREKQASQVPDDCPRFRVLCRRSAEWAHHRARAIAMKRNDVVAVCCKRKAKIECACGPIRLDVGCDQTMLCARCRREHSKRWRKRIVAGMDAALRDERARYYRTPKHRRYGMRPGIYMITLTGPHSGDFDTDRDVMGKAVRKVLKHGTKYGWWSTYALTWEATPGDDGKGHLHVHLAVISSWIPYSDHVHDRELRAADVPYEPRRAARFRVLGESEPMWEAKRERRATRGLHQVWRDAMPGALVLDVRPPSSGDAAMSAGIYLAKYVTKGVDPDTFTGAKAGELLAAFRCRRKVSTSAGFWIPREHACQTCGVFYEMTESPTSIHVAVRATLPEPRSQFYEDYLDRQRYERSLIKQEAWPW